MEIQSKVLCYCSDDDMTAILETTFDEGNIVKREVTGFFFGKPTDDKDDFQMPLKVTLEDGPYAPDEVRESKYVIYSELFDFSFVVKEINALDDDVGIITIEITGFFQGQPTNVKAELDSPLVINY